MAIKLKNLCLLIGNSFDFSRAALQKNWLYEPAGKYQPFATQPASHGYFWPKWSREKYITQNYFHS